MNPSTTVHSPLRLYGRSGELALLDELSGRLRDGRGSTLVITGPPGLGRSALARHAVGNQREGTVLHTRAAPAEARLPYSGLHALLCSAPGPLPGPADDVTRAGTAPTALLELLRILGSHGPLLLCVDDAHAWDRDSRIALGFAARRLAPRDRAAVVLTATDDPGGGDAFTGLPRLRLGPLDDTAAGALIDRLTEGRADPLVRDELRREAAGNPGLLTALTARLTPDQLAGHAPLPHPLPGAERILDAYAARAEVLPPDTRLLLLLAAAAEEHEPEGAGADAALLLRAARLAGIDADRLLPAERTGTLHNDGTRVRFTHPLLRTAVLRRAPLPRRRAAHRLLAAALDGPHLTLPRLVQRACAAGGYDPFLADALAGAATAPRPHTDRATALARAAELTADETLRGVRFSAAAEHAWLDGEPGRARALLARVRAVPASGRAHHVRGLIALCDGPVADARESLLAAAALLAADDADRSTAALLAAADAAWAMGDPHGYVDALARVPAAVTDAPDPDRSPRSATAPRARTGGPDGHEVLGRYVEGLLAVFAGRTGTGQALLRECVEASGHAGDPSVLLRSAAAALVVGDVDAACRAGARALAAVRVHGPRVMLPPALERLAYAELRAGRHARARVHALEGLRAALELGRRNSAAHLHAVLALTASLEGDAEACAEHAAAAGSTAAAHGLSQAASLAVWAVARTDLAAGRCAEAAARLRPLVVPGPRRGHFAVMMLAVPCFVEAAVLAGRTDGTAVAVEEFAAWAASTADPLAPAQLARCRALVAPPEEAAARYEEALAHHERAGGDFERARTLLLYGQWLRRRRRTREARGPLRDALVAFERCGARGWAERAGGELRAAGEAVSGDSGSGPLDRLTPQQRRIAHHVAEGATNREVALRLSVSTRTVDHHLRNVFALLGVRSRTELARLLERSGA
ncbi:helix-turn-helix transcriptional regulator [Streptomyces kurssanovii]|uniref:LuxR C-terminal-related transcriptional regulator n=1 Tax=Streptomyces kurssanovii TaxID=67312 RepID=A0ABV3I2P0_9ACTN